MIINGHTCAVCIPSRSNFVISTCLSNSAWATRKSASAYKEAVDETELPPRFHNNHLIGASDFRASNISLETSHSTRAGNSTACYMLKQFEGQLVEFRSAAASKVTNEKVVKRFQDESLYHLNEPKKFPCAGQ